MNQAQIAHPGYAKTARDVLSLFKLRIGVIIMLTAMAGYAITPGPSIGGISLAILALAVLLSSASAGAFNQYIECEEDRLMPRTRTRAFVTGALPHTPAWLVLIGVMLVGSIAAAWYVSNAVAALYTFLGAFFYAVVYTVWLKRRSWLNIVVGGLAGSFAVLAGAAAVNPLLSVEPLLLALVLFLWTPPHFWSLAIANRAEYAAASVPMLPVVVGDARAAQIVFFSTVALVLVSLIAPLLAAAPVYFAGALIGGGYFIRKSWQLAQHPSRASALASFFASLIQLSLLLVAAMLDVWVVQ